VEFGFLVIDSIWLATSASITEITSCLAVEQCKHKQKHKIIGLIIHQMKIRCFEQMHIEIILHRRPIPSQTNSD
jgi:hypothetical protein